MISGRGTEREAMERRISEFHRYFPEWAQRPASEGVPREAERNSYLAGGYAEEFGYRASPDRPPEWPAPDEAPERNALWRMQIDALHPGYPERPAPLDWAAADEHIATMPPVIHAGRHGLAQRAEPVAFRIIRVGVYSGPAQSHDGSAQSRLAVRFGVAGFGLLARMGALRGRRREPDR